MNDTCKFQIGSSALLSFFTSSKPKPGHAWEVPAIHKFLQTMSDGSISPGWWCNFSIIKVASYLQLKEHGLVSQSVAPPLDITPLQEVGRMLELACLTLQRQIIFSTKWSIVSKNYTNPTKGGMEATPGTSPATLTCRKIKSTFSSVYTKCCQEIKTKNLL